MQFILRRFALSIVVLFVATVIIFFGLSAIGDPLGELRSDPSISQEALQRLIDRKHLDDPLIVQYGYWLQEMVFNQFGTDLKYDRPIWPELSRALGTTLQVVVAAEVLAILVAIVIGTLAARFQYSLFDYGTTLASFIGYAIPVFWLALILQILTVNFYEATGLRIFYISGLSSLDAGTGMAWLIDRIQHLVLPVLVLSIASIASHSRYVRASMLEVINSDYVRTARAKGVDERTVLIRHSLRNATLPLVTVIGVSLGNLFNGTILIETIFSMPGMGLYFFNALNARDIYSLMAWLVITSGIMLLMNLITDILYGVLDPRISK
jgi:peptide/nickel transport system permease protein